MNSMPMFIWIIWMVAAMIVIYLTITHLYDKQYKRKRIVKYKNLEQLASMKYKPGYKFYIETKKDSHEIQIYKAENELHVNHFGVRPDETLEEFLRDYRIHLIVPLIAKRYREK